MSALWSASAESRRVNGGQLWAALVGSYSQMDLSQFDAAPLIAFIAAKETDYGTETDGRIPC